MKKIFAREEKIGECQDNSYKAVAKIRKISTDIVKKEFLSVNTSRELTSKELWSHLKIQYTL